PLPGIGVDQIGVVAEARDGRPTEHLDAPILELTDVVSPGELDRTTATVLIPVAISLRRVAEVGARIVALLSRRRPPDLAVIPKAPALVHELRQIVHDPVRLIEADPLAERIQRPDYGRNICPVRTRMRERHELINRQLHAVLLM